MNKTSFIMSSLKKFAKYFSVMIVFMCVGYTEAQWWLFSPKDIRDFRTSESQTVCSRLTGLSRNQRTLCEVYPNHMPFVAKGAMMGAEECQWQFQGLRWNCSVLAPNQDGDNNNAYNKMVSIGSKETAVSYAIASAGIVYSIAKACKNEKLAECGCSQHARPEGLGRDWNWGGCGDNTEYAYGFAREFVDAKESNNVSPQTQKSRDKRTMNLHNNEAGRLAVVHSVHPACKCHGVSGSCSLKTCWMQIPDFRVIGKRLRKAYEDAVEAKITKRGKIRPRSKTNEITIKSLIHLDASPDYCFSSNRQGVPGTRGRECNADSEKEDGCGFVCCGRGHTTQTVTVVERCNCNFQWCCVVKCEKCQKTVKRHICN